MRDVNFTEENGKIIQVLSKIPRFELFSNEELNAFVNAGVIREYNPGDAVIREGEYDCWVYFLLTGELEITQGGKTVGYLKRTGDLFGEMGVIDASPRSATIQARKKSMLLGYDASYIDQKLKINEINFCYVVYRLFSEVLAVRLRETTRENTELRAALSKFGNLKH